MKSGLPHGWVYYTSLLVALGLSVGGTSLLYLLLVYPLKRRSTPEAVQYIYDRHRQNSEDELLSFAKNQVDEYSSGKRAKKNLLMLVFFYALFSFWIIYVIVDWSAHKYSNNLIPCLLLAITLGFAGVITVLYLMSVTSHRIVRNYLHDNGNRADDAVASN